MRSVRRPKRERVEATWIVARFIERFARLQVGRRRCGRFRLLLHGQFVITDGIGRCTGRRADGINFFFPIITMDASGAAVASFVGMIVVDFDFDYRR